MTQTAPPPAKPAFKMPPAYIGMPCLHFNSEAEWKKYTGQIPSTDHVRPTAALVTLAGTRNLSLILFPCDHDQPTYRNGVKHASDPERTRVDTEKTGFWDYAMPMEKVAMDAVMGELNKVNEELANTKQLVDMLLEERTSGKGGKK